MSQEKKRIALITASQIDQASAEMINKPKVTPEKVSLRSAIKKLHKSIVHMLDNGHDWNAIAEVLREKGISINASTLKTYTYENNRALKKNQQHVGICLTRDS